jgi:hypothetical protein
MPAVIPSNSRLHDEVELVNVIALRSGRITDQSISFPYGPRSATRRVVFPLSNARCASPGESNLLECFTHYMVPGIQIFRDSISSTSGGNGNG